MLVSSRPVSLQCFCLMAPCDSFAHPALSRSARRRCRLRRTAVLKSQKLSSALLSELTFHDQRYSDNLVDDKEKHNINPIAVGTCSIEQRLDRMEHLLHTIASVTCGGDTCCEWNVHEASGGNVEALFSQLLPEYESPDRSAQIAETSALNACAPVFVPGPTLVEKNVLLRFRDSADMIGLEKPDVLSGLTTAWIQVKPQQYALWASGSKQFIKPDSATENEIMNEAASRMQLFFREEIFRLGCGSSCAGSRVQDASEASACDSCDADETDDAAIVKAFVLSTCSNRTECTIPADKAEQINTWVCDAINQALANKDKAQAVRDFWKEWTEKERDVPKDLQAPLVRFLDDKMSSLGFATLRELVAT